MMEAWSTVLAVTALGLFGVVVLAVLVGFCFILLALLKDS